MINLLEHCPNCGAGKEWFMVISADTICGNCDVDLVEKVEKVETSDESRAEAKANCSLFAQPVSKVEPVDPEILRAEREARQVNLIQIKFWNAQFSFQNGNEAPVTGQITGQTHQTKLLRRAMELARDEGKELRVINGMDMRGFKTVTDKDIQIYCK